jgi:hypothetical protein
MLHCKYRIFLILVGIGFETTENHFITESSSLSEDDYVLEEPDLNKNKRKSASKEITTKGYRGY